MNELAEYAVRHDQCVDCILAWHLAGTHPRLVSQVGESLRMRMQHLRGLRKKCLWAAIVLVGAAEPQKEARRREVGGTCVWQAIGQKQPQSRAFLGSSIIDSPSRLAPGALTPSRRIRRTCLGHPWRLPGKPECHCVLYLWCCLPT